MIRDKTGDFYETGVPRLVASPAPPPHPAPPRPTPTLSDGYRSKRQPPRMEGFLHGWIAWTLPLHPARVTQAIKTIYGEMCQERYGQDTVPEGTTR